MAEALATFTGAVSCQAGAGALGLTLSGDTLERPGERTTLTFSAPAPAGLPVSLAGVRVDEPAPGQYRLSSGAREWRLAAAAVHLHRDVGPAFYRAIPPRAVPLAKRALWAVVLALAASRGGLALLRLLRR